MKTFAFRLLPGQDLKQEIANFVKRENIQAGIILTCVGSLAKARLRMADETIIREFNERFEITSLVGTLSQDGVHLHISLSNKDGTTIGGHLLDGCSIYVTAEIVVLELSNFEFLREFDEKTGFKELKIN